MVFETERLILREFREDDFETFFRNSTGEQFNKYYPENVTSRESFERLFSSIMLWQDEVPRRKFQMAVCLKAGQLIGTCGVRVESPEDGEAVFGCSIASDHWKKGYAREAGRRLIDFAFTSLPINRIYSDTVSENMRARALVEKMGMTMEGELRENKFFRDRWWNTAIYSILKSEWGQTDSLER